VPVSGMAVPGMAMQPQPGYPVASMGMGGMAPVVSMQQQAMGMATMAPGMVAPGVPMATMGGAPVVTSAGPVAPMVAAHAPPVPAAMASEAWEVPLSTQSKYGAIFAATDKARVGVLAGVQARNILLQSGLPQNVLAQIWSLSDHDKDGRLSREEFILSGHLCDLAAKGEPLPAVLPAGLVPPSMRRPGAPGMAPTPSASGASDGGASTPGSVVGGSSAAGDSFEDKRRENFNKGQQELDRRRQSLIDQQKREEEERKRKEKEEEEERQRQK